MHKVWTYLQTALLFRKYIAYNKEAFGSFQLCTLHLHGLNKRKESNSRHRIKYKK